MMNITEEMQATMDRLFAAVEGKFPVEVQYEMKVLPGGIKNSQFVVRVGDIMKNHELVLEPSLVTAEAKVMEKLPWMLKNTDHEMNELRKLAEKHGVKIVEPAPKAA